MITSVIDFFNKGNPHAYQSIMFFIILIIFQIVVMSFFTYGKTFSIAAMFRNIYASIFFYFFHRTKMNILLNIFSSLVLAHIACFITSIIEVKLTSVPLLDNNVTTTYLYDDVLHDVNILANNDSIPAQNVVKKLTEWMFEPQDMGIDFDDTSSENVNNVYKVGKDIFTTKHDNGLIYNINGKDVDVGKIRDVAEYRKYDWILSHISINNDTRILELGFGNLGFMNYARTKNIKHIEGVNLSSVQCKQAEAEGYKVYHANVNDIDKIDIGKYDLILNDGMLEHLITKSTKTVFHPEGNEEEVYTLFMKKISNCLKPGGVFVNTIITADNDVEYDSTLLTVWYGNNGLYPEENAFIRSAKNAGLTKKVSLDKTLHYYMSMLMRGTVQLNTTGQSSFLKYLFLSLAHPNIIASHICYNGLPDEIFPRDIIYNTYSWIYHFVPNKTADGKYKYGTQLTKHRWIVFTK
jgi:cyclopropane fatty-acyl-phospholipid synthase-like methyltransferase